MKILIFVTVLFLSGVAYYFFSAPSTNMNTEKVVEYNIALKGFDVVAYFKDSQAIEGNKAHSATWKNQVWYFSTDDNKKLFEKEPQKYIPQYGGYCAWAVGHNYTAPSDPLAWKIQNGKLYLNYNFDVQKNWEVDMEKYIVDGDENWKKLEKEANQKSQEK